MIVSDKISVTSAGKKHNLIVFGGNEWISMIKETIENAKNAPEAPVVAKEISSQGDYTDELVRLKQLCDSGVITEEEFAIKKRQLLGI